MTIFDLKTGRRRVLRSGLALGAVALAAPAYVRNAFASSGEVSWFTWEDYAPQVLVDQFTKDTGIKLNVTTFSSNEDQLNKLKAAGGSGWDIASPSIQWTTAHIEAGTLQGLDFSRIKNLDAISESLMKKSEAMGVIKDGKWYSLPYVWGTEAIAYNADVVKFEYGKLSYGDLWRPEFKGKMLCRQRSILVGTGLWMERTGELPEGTMRKAYDDEAAFDLGYGKAAEFVIANKAQIVNWWKGSADTQSGFLQDGAVVGMTWDGPIIQMRNEGRNMAFMAPIEGATQWMDALALTAGAKNIDQAYAFIDWSLQPQIGAIMADATGYNSVVRGFEKRVSDKFRENFAMAYPGDAVDRLWLQGIERPWLLEKRQKLVDKLSAAA